MSALVNVNTTTMVDFHLTPVDLNNSHTRTYLDPKPIKLYLVGSIIYS